jgi:hypothetical protein
MLAGASLHIYLVHWQIYPHLENSHPLLATLLSLLCGIGFWKLATAATPYVEGRVADAARSIRRVRRTPGRRFVGTEIGQLVK